MSNMGTWKVAEAKQRFAEVIRRSESEPQKIYRRDRLVAAVVNPGAVERLHQMERELSARTLADLLAEAREICAGEEYSLEVGARADREGWPGSET